MVYQGQCPIDAYCPVGMRGAAALSGGTAIVIQNATPEFQKKLRGLLGSK